MLALSLAAFGQTHHVPQSRDWLVRKPVDATTLSATKDGTLTLGNRLVERQFFANASSGAFCTTDLRRVDSPFTFFRALSAEANVTLNGTFGFDVGRCDFAPPPGTSGRLEFFEPGYRKALVSNSSAWQYVSHAASKVEAPFAWSYELAAKRKFMAPNVSWPPPGVHLAVLFAAPRAHRYPCVQDAAGTCPCPISGGLDLSGVNVTVHYEGYDGLPVVRKWVTVSSATVAIEVSALHYELLRAPNWAPERMSVRIPMASNPAPFDDTIKPDALSMNAPGQPPPSRTGLGEIPAVADLPSARNTQYWFFDLGSRPGKNGYERCCDGSLHVGWSYYTYLSLGYSFSFAYNGSTGPGAIVRPGQSFESLSVRLLLHDTNEVERKSLGIREMQRTLAPQLREAPLSAMINDVSSTAIFRQTIDQMAATGLNLAILGYGCPGWHAMNHVDMKNETYKAWLKGEIEYANGKGISVSAYTLMQSAGGILSSMPNEDTLKRNGKKGVACFATGWHDRWRASVLAYMSDVGLSGLETDGQYEGAPCADNSSDHDHHHNGIKGGWSGQIGAALTFNTKLKAQGAYQTGADAYYWHGANRWNHADTDAFRGLPLWELHTEGRAYVYDSTRGRLPTSGNAWVGDVASATNATWNGRYNASHDRCGGRPRIACMGYYLNAVQAGIHARLLWSAPPGAAALDPDHAEIARVMKKWTTYWVHHATPRNPPRNTAPGLLLDKMIHLLRPTSRSLEAVLHVTADDSTPTRGLLSVVNPTNTTLAANITLPLYYANIRPGDVVTLASLVIEGEKAAVDAHRCSILGGDREHIVGSDGAGFTGAVAALKVQPSSYCVIVVTLQPRTHDAVKTDDAAATDTSNFTQDAIRFFMTQQGQALYWAVATVMISLPLIMLLFSAQLSIESRVDKLLFLGCFLFLAAVLGVALFKFSASSSGGRPDKTN